MGLPGKKGQDSGIWERYCGPSQLAFLLTVDRLTCIQQWEHVLHILYDNQKPQDYCRVVKSSRLPAEIAIYFIILAGYTAVQLFEKINIFPKKSIHCLKAHYLKAS